MKRGQPFAGPSVCYSGYRQGQSPVERVYPSLAQIREDLHLLRPRFCNLRLYDCSLHAERVLQVLREDALPFRVLLGAALGAEASNPGCAWGGVHDADTLAANAAENEAEIARLVALAARHADIVAAVAVGNETTPDWTDHLVPVECMRHYLQRVRQAVAQPVTFCENYVPWLDRLEGVVPELDFISVHSYPQWEHHGVATAMAHTEANLAAVARRWPGVPLVLSEAGWCTASHGRGIPPAHASPDLQARHLHELSHWARDTGTPTFLFEAFDEPWKGSLDPLEPEKHWGLYTVDRRPKPALAALASCAEVQPR